MVIVALGERGTPVICWAMAGTAGASAPALRVRPQRSMVVS
jgi:hypothetical protein